MTGFVRKWGWRAYALPILTAITIAVLVQHGASRPTAAPHTSDAAHTTVEGAPASGFAGYQPASTPRPVLVRSQDDSDSCATNKTGQLALVSIRLQHAWFCLGPKQVFSTAVTTGALKADHRTPTGSWQVQGKQRNRYLVGPGYKDYVHYWVPFNGDFGFHDATWQTMAFGSPDYRTDGSHGCVHLPTPAMQWLYKWAAVGTVVTITR